MASRANPPHTGSPAQQGLGGHSLAPSPLGPSQAAAVPPPVRFLCLQRSVPSAAKRVPAGTIPQDTETSDPKGLWALGKSRGLHSGPRSCPCSAGYEHRDNLGAALPIPKGALPNPGELHAALPVPPQPLHAFTSRSEPSSPPPPCSHVGEPPRRLSTHSLSSRLLPGKPACRNSQCLPSPAASPAASLP